MNRRRALMLLAGGAALAGPAGAGVAAFRLHRAPRRDPFLTEAHLAGLAMEPGQGRGQGPRVLFVGNSMLLRHDVPGQVAALAARDGVALRPALAAAHGARLVESYRLGALRALLAPGLWEAVVLQDFSKTPLRAVDRWGSAWAMAGMAARAAPAPVLLFPPWPAAAGGGVYRSAGLLTAVPEGPADFAARTMAFYAGTARRIGAGVAPVPAAWAAALAGGADLYAEDGHHAGPAGAALTARVLWDSLRAPLAAG